MKRNNVIFIPLPFLGRVVMVRNYQQKEFLDTAFGVTNQIRLPLISGFAVWCLLDEKATLSRRECT